MSKMYMRKISYFVFAVFLAFDSSSQKTPLSGTELQLLHQGIKLFEAGHYESASNYFTQAKESDWSQVYLALIDLYDKNNELATRKILSENWESEGYFYLTNRYVKHLMDSEEYRKVSELIERLPSEAYTVKEYEELRYQLGLSYYRQEEYDWAKPVFEEVTYYRGENYHRANYYLGIIYFKKGDKSSSLYYFQEANQSEELQKHTFPYMAEGFLVEKNYQGLIDFLTNKTSGIKDESLLFTSNIYLGEAYFALKNYSKAVEYFREAARISYHELPYPTKYRIGYAYEKEKRFPFAIDYYKDVGRENSALGQLAAFRLGQVYMEQNEYDYAVNAYDKAAALQHNEEITEKALFLKGKLLIQQQQYDRAIRAFNQYLKDYPNSENSLKASGLLASAYLSTSDYHKAMDHLEQSGVRTREAKKTYQNVTFKAGLQEFNNENFSQAIQLFSKSVQYPIDRELAGQGYLMMGECLSVQQNFIEALSYYQRSAQLLSPRSENFDRLLYGRGYSYFNTGQYDLALTDFSTILRIGEKGALKSDATARVGDCYFVKKQYDDAVRFYNRVLNTAIGDYATFQLGTIAFLRENTENAEIFYKRVLSTYPNSVYADNASFQLGKLYFEGENFSVASEKYTNLIRNFPGSILIPRAYLDRGLSYSNLGELERAYRDFRVILEEYPDHEVAENALLGMQSLQKKGYEIHKMDEYISRLKSGSGEQDKFEMIEFEQAKNYYFNQQYTEAISALKKYISDYPDSGSRSEAFYYLGESYFRKKEWNEAVNWFSDIEENSLYFTRSLDKKGLALQNSGNFGDAAKNYHKLKKYARTPKDNYNALEGLLISGFHLEQYDSVVYYGDQIIQSGWKPANAEFLVKLYTARSFDKLGQVNKASDLFIELVNSSNERYAAEALFYLGKIQFEKGNFPLSVETLLDLIGNYPAYSEWTDKAYLLLVDNYIEMSEFLQAEATLNSIIKNTQNEELRSVAENKLQSMKKPEGQNSEGQ